MDFDLLALKLGEMLSGAVELPLSVCFIGGLACFFLKVILCPEEHRNQPDVSHQAFNFRRESMTQLLWGHGGKIPGYLKKIINYGNSDREDGNVSRVIISALFKKWAL